MKSTKLCSYLYPKVESAPRLLLVILLTFSMLMLAKVEAFAEVKDLGIVSAQINGAKGEGQGVSFQKNTSAQKREQRLQKEFAAKDNGKFRPGEVLIKYKKHVTEAVTEQKHRKHGSKRLKKFKRLNIELAGLDSAESVEAAVKRLASDPDVEYAEPNYIVTTLQTPVDTYWPLWGMETISAPAAWDITTGSQDVVIAVIDSGIDANHPDIIDNLWINPTPGYDWNGDGQIDVSNDTNGWNALDNNGIPTDDLGHGTHVAGIIGAFGNNDVGVTGVNWHVRIMACKFLNSSGSGAISDAIECLEYIRTQKEEKGVNIVASNNSWGGSGYSQALRDAIKEQQRLGILFVAAAGNSAADLDNPAARFYPAMYSLPNVISVAATDINEELAWFSSYGQTSVHVAAPGDDILSLRAPGTYAYGNYPTNFVPQGDPNAEYIRLSGTSMAAPHVAGLAALIKAAKPETDWVAIRNLILAGGEPKASLANITASGRRIDANGSLSCTNRPLLAVVKSPRVLEPGGPVVLAAISSNCESPIGPVTVTFSDLNIPPLTLNDRGLDGDETADDGIFSGTWTPTSSNQMQFTFSSPSGSQTIESAITLQGYGGGNAQLWEKVLPLDGQSPGPAMAVASNGTIHIVGSSASNLVALALSDNAESTLWTTSVSNVGRGIAVVADSVGATYALSSTSRVIRFDANGNELWQRQAGLSSPKKLALEPDGTLAAFGNDPGSSSVVRIERFTADGAPLPAVTYADQEGRSLDPADFVFDAAGNRYLLATKSSVTTHDDFLLVKLDSAGSVLWVRQYNHHGYSMIRRAEFDYFDQAKSLVIDRLGNIFVAGGGCDYYCVDFNYVLYDPNGNLISETYLDYYGIPSDLAIDSENRLTAILNGTSGSQPYAEVMAFEQYNPDFNFGSTYNWSLFDFDRTGNAVRYGADDNLYAIETSRANDVAYLRRSVLLPYFQSPTLPEAALNASYSVQLAAQYGLKPYRWSISSGSLPIGLVIDSATGTISGTPTQVGTSSFSVELRDARGIAVSNPCTITVNDLPLITTASPLPVASSGNTYTQAFSVSSGHAPYSWAFESGVLPNGLSFDSATGSIKGTPLALGTFIFTIRVTDSLGGSSVKEFSLTVQYAPPVSISGVPPYLTAWIPYGFSYGPKGGAEPFDWSVTSGTLPPGLSLDRASGKLTGTPSQTGVFAFTVRMVDAQGKSVSLNNTLTVFPKTTLKQQTQLLLSTQESGYTEPSDANTVVDKNGNIYMATCGRLLSDSSKLYYLVRKFDQNGNKLWTKALLSLSGYEAVPNIAVNASGTTVTIATYGSPELLTLSFSQLDTSTGALRWSTSTVPPQTYGNNYSIRYDRNDNLMVFYRSTLIRVRSDGVVLSAQAFSSPIVGAASDSTGALYVLANSLYKYDAAGNLLWATPSSYGERYDVTVDDTDNAYIIYDNYYRLDTVKYSPAGTELWRREVYDFSPHFTTFSPKPCRLASGGTDRMYISCAARSFSDTMDFLTVTYDGSGNLLDAVTYDGGNRAFYYALDYTDSITYQGGALFVAGKTYDENDKWYYTLDKLRNVAVIKYTVSLNIEPATLPPVAVGAAYSQVITVTGGVAPYAGAIVAGELPQGFAFDPATLSITGSSAIKGDYTFTIRISDKNGAWTEKTYTIKVYGPLIPPDPLPPLPYGIVGKPYNHILGFSGGLAPYSWSVSNGQLPPGLSLDASSGTISGIPTAIGNYGFTIHVEDASGQSSSGQFPLTVYDPLIIETVSLPPGTRAVSYTKTVVASGGTGVYTWSIVAGSGQLPTGLSLDPSTGVISGAPTLTGDSGFTIQVSDTVGQTITREFVLSVFDPLVIVTGTLPKGMLTYPYLQSVTASGGRSPYSWSLAENNILPDGLSLDAVTGVISGTPTVSGNFTFVLKVMDLNGVAATHQYDLTIGIPLHFVTQSLTDGTFGVPFSQSIIVAGGRPNYTLTLTGNLPVGLTFDASTRYIGGTPQTDGVFPISVRVTDLDGTTVTQNYTLTIRGGVVSTLWQRRFDGGGDDSASSVATDANGNTYVTGTASVGSTTNIRIVKYDATGQEVWSVNYDSGGNETGMDIAVDGGGNVYVTGDTLVGGIRNGVILKYDMNGNLVWSRSFDGGGDDFMNEIAADAAGNVYVGGTNTGSTGLRVLKYDTAGNLTWNRLYATGGTNAKTRALTVDTAGYIYVGGYYTYNSNDRQMIIKIDGNGNQIWYDNSRIGIYIQGLSVDNSGSIVVAGSLLAGLSHKMYVAKYDKNRIALWSKTFTNNIITYTTSIGESVAVDVAGNIYVTGKGYAPKATSPAYYNLLTVKYDTNGNLRWVRSEDGPAGKDDTANGVAVAADGRLFVTGTVQTSTNKDWMTLAYEQLEISPSILLPASIGAPYQQQLTTSASRGPFAWSVASGTLPPGVTLDGNAGTLTGNALTAGSYAFSIRMSDVTGANVTRNYTLLVQ